MFFSFSLAVIFWWVGWRGSFLILKCWAPLFLNKTPQIFSSMCDSYYKDVPISPSLLCSEKNPELVLQWAAESKCHWITSLCHSCFFSSKWCGAEKSLLLWVNGRGWEKEGIVVRAVRLLMLSCLSMLVGEECSVCSEAPWLHYLEGQPGLINGPLGEKHLSHHLQCNTHGHGVMETHGYTIRAHNINNKHVASHSIKWKNPTKNKTQRSQCFVRAVLSWSLLQADRGSYCGVSDERAELKCLLLTGYAVTTLHSSSHWWASESNDSPQLMCMGMKNKDQLLFHLEWVGTLLPLNVPS